MQEGPLAPHPQDRATWDQPGVRHTAPQEAVGWGAALCTCKRAPHPEVHGAGQARPGLAVLGASRVEEAVFSGWNVQNVGQAPSSSPQPALTMLTSLSSAFLPHKGGALVGVRVFGQGAALRLLIAGA